MQAARQAAHLQEDGTAACLALVPQTAASVAAAAQAPGLARAQKAASPAAAAEELAPIQAGKVASAAAAQAARHPGA